MGNKFISVQFEPLKKSEMVVAIKMNKEKKVSQIDTKSSNDSLIEFLQSKNTFQKLYSHLEEIMTKALPANVGENCRKCKPELFDQNTYPNEKGVFVLGNCDVYKSQMSVTYLVAANEFIKIVRRNQMIFENKSFLKKLTFQFFACFGFIKGKGILIFNLSRLCNKLLESGFLLISEIFAKSDSLKNLDIINNTIDSIDMSLMNIHIYGKEDFDNLELQRHFFIKKREFYKEKLWINSHLKENQSLLINNGKSNRPNRTDIAYFCYYATKSKEYKTKNAFPSNAAWKEVASKFERNAKNIQQVYNLIANNQSERLKKSKITNIKHVLEQMLSDYPKAKKHALDELKIAELNS